jgi:hypothetical protein
MLYTASRSDSGVSCSKKSCRLKPAKSSSKPLSSVVSTPSSAFEEGANPFPLGPSSFSSTSNGSGVLETAAGRLGPVPLGFRDEANKDAVESLETKEREEERGVKPGRWGAEVGAR